jgi:hypothetical protein
MEKRNAEEGLKMTPLASSAHVSERPGPVALENRLDPGGNFVQGGIPGDTFEMIPHPF